MTVAVKGNTATDAFRPTALADVIGQDAVKDELLVAIKAANARGDMPGPILFTGPAGTGKTTLALIVANMLGGRLVQMIGPQVRGISDVLNPLMRARPRDVLFIDEIHRIYRPVQEFLLPVMEDGKIADGDVTIALPPMTIVGATTDPKRLLTPLLDRFTRILALKPYAPSELNLIVERAAHKLGCELGDGAGLLIGQNASGIPRVALRMMLAARDYAYAGGPPKLGTAALPIVTITLANVQDVLNSPAYEWRVEGRSASDR